MNKKINMNEEISINLNYTGTSPDTLFYAGVFIYDYDVVAAMSFEFLQFKFKIWNHFS